jgi:hypothetical protein
MMTSRQRVAKRFVPSEGWVRRDFVVSMSWSQEAATRTTTASNVTNSYFLFQAGLIPIVFLMTDPSNQRKYIQHIPCPKSRAHIVRHVI